MHALKHFLGLYAGRVVTFCMDGVYYVGFQCGECGDITGVTRMREAVKP